MKKFISVFAVFALVLPVVAGLGSVFAQKQRERYDDKVKEIIVRLEPSLADGAMCVGKQYKLSFFAVNRYNKPVRSKATTTINNPSGSGEGLQPRGASAVYHRVSQRIDRWPATGSAFYIYMKVKGVGGASASKQMNIPIRYCLDGRWSDGKRTFRLEHKGNSVTAHVISGMTCNRRISPKFTGTLKGKRLNVKNLVVCEPKACADAQGRRQKKMLATWRAKVSKDGRVITGKWKRKWFDYVRRDGKVVGCRLNSAKAKWIDYTIVRR